MENRQCGDCQLCCKLLPVRELGKKANTRCRYQRHGKGCKVYGRRPHSCRLWNCRWLGGDVPAGIRRPDRAGYVIDVMPDFIEFKNEEGLMRFPIIQIWVDPLHSLAYRDHRLLAYLEKQWEIGVLGLVRFDSRAAIVMIPPAWSGEPDWIERGGTTGTVEHSTEQILGAIAAAN
jgi:hypothetical protein